MANKKVEVKAEGHYTFSYDPNSKEFKEALESFRESIDKDGTEEDLILNAAHQLRLGGSDRMLEGIGYVKCREKIEGEPYSGIEVDDDDPSYDYEVE